MCLQENSSSTDCSTTIARLLKLRQHCLRSKRWAQQMFGKEHIWLTHTSGRCLCTSRSLTDRLVRARLESRLVGKSVGLDYCLGLAECVSPFFMINYGDMQQAKICFFKSKPIAVIFKLKKKLFELSNLVCRKNVFCSPGSPTSGFPWGIVNKLRNKIYQERKHRSKICLAGLIHSQTC